MSKNKRPTILINVRCSTCNNIFKKRIELAENGGAGTSKVDAYCPFCGKWVNVEIPYKVASGRVVRGD